MMKSLRGFVGMKRKPLRRRVIRWIIVIILIAAPELLHSEDAVDFRIESPRPYQVVQRMGYEPTQAYANHPGGPKLGFAHVPIRLEIKDPVIDKLEYRTVLLADAFGQSLDWTPLPGQRSGSHFTGQARIPAGGWFRLEVRAHGKDQSMVESVEPTGVGEVFIIAGQSYAAGENESLLQLNDPHGRAVAYDMVLEKWQVANDPQPNIGEKGTIWPPMCDALLPLIQVPIGMINVTSSGTGSWQWLPGEPLYENLRKAGLEAGRFRALLWQQGETDVIKGTSMNKYAENMMAIQSTLACQWEFAPPWLLAKSTYHPTQYNYPSKEEAIRNAIDVLCAQSEFMPGPDTDILGGENRAPDESDYAESCEHFSTIGQKRAGLMWFATIWGYLSTDQLHAIDKQRSNKQ